MVLATFYMQLHQPRRLDKRRGRFFADDENERIFRDVAAKCYVPAVDMFREVMEECPDFRLTFSMSGTFLEQAELYEPKVIEGLQRLHEAGKGRVEFLDETYYHSLAGLFADKRLREFREQVAMHRSAMGKHFGVKPKSFRNTELMYNDRIAAAAAEMGYASILCERRDDMYRPQDGRPVSPNTAFRAKGKDLIVIPRNRELSDEIAFRYRTHVPSPQMAGDFAKRYAEWIAKIDGELALIGIDFETIFAHLPRESGIGETWRGIPRELGRYPNVVPVTCSEAADRVKGGKLPTVSINPLSTSSWADKDRDTYGWLGNTAQKAIFRLLQEMEKAAKKVDGRELERWRYLTTSDNLYYLHEGVGPDGEVHQFFSPYQRPEQAVYAFLDKMMGLEAGVEAAKTRSAAVHSKRPKTAVLIVTPETGPIPPGMGELARYVSGKTGGQGEVITALLEGLEEHGEESGFEANIALPNLRERFRQESGMTEKEWVRMRYRTAGGRVHLVSTREFRGKRSLYDGNEEEKTRTAAAFQEHLVTDTIKDVSAKYGGRLILHFHGPQGSGVPAAYGCMRGIPILSTQHSIHTVLVPLEMFDDIDIGSIWNRLCIKWEHGKPHMDSTDTELRNATLVNGVDDGTFFGEIKNGWYRDIIGGGYIVELLAKMNHGQTFAVMNAPSLSKYPERSEFLARNFGPEDNVLEAKGENLAELQRILELRRDPDAILYLWPSRLDPFQKGIQYFAEIAMPFVRANPDVQIAVIGDGVDGDETYERAMGGIAFASEGRIAFKTYREAKDPLTRLAYAAARGVVGCSRFAPCEQTDQDANLCGGRAVNRRGGGNTAKIRQGFNGILFNDYDAGALWWGLTEDLKFQRQPPEYRENVMREIMRYVRERDSPENMHAGYMGAYERLREKIQA